MKRIKGQVLFLRGLSYYNLVGYYQNPPLITDYATYLHWMDFIPATAHTMPYSTSGK